MDLRTYFQNLPRGAQLDLAVKLGISKSYMSQLVTGTAPMSAKRAVEIEQATDGAVTRKDLKPDDWNLIWPELETAA